MSTTLENNTTVDSIPISDAARDMRQSMGAVKVSFTWMGTRRSLSDAQNRQAASTFDADANQVTTYKKLIDTKHPAYKALTRLKNQVTSYWRGITLPYPTDGVRLMRRDDIEGFETRMQEFNTQLQEAVANLQLEYESIKTAAREHLGSLYNPDDYPASLQGAFAISWEYPPVEPPRYLMTFNPELYEAEQRRIQQRFESAVAMAEDAFTGELQSLVEHLIERLTDNADGTPKTFQRSTVENFREFYTQFRNLNVRGNSELDELVTRANNLVAGIEAQDLRDNRDLRQSISQQMGEVRTALDSLVQNAPRRRLTPLE